MRILNPSLLSRVSMLGIVGHWSAGPAKATSLDKEHYHVITEGSGNIVYGVSIAKNSGKAHPGYAAHTRGANTNRIGQSMAGMMNAVENPFSPGPAPITTIQWANHVLATADLCEFYKIPVTTDKVLFHAEVEKVLGIKQAGKWDVARLPFDPSIKGARAIGDRWRDEVLSALRGNGPEIAMPNPEPVPAAAIGATGRVTAPTLNFRRGPGTAHESTGSLPNGTPITILAFSGDWLQVRTPAGYTGWVHGGYVQLLNTASSETATKPDVMRSILSGLQDQLDDISAESPIDPAKLKALLGDAMSRIPN